MREGEAVPGTVSRRVAGLQCLADCPKIQWSRTSLVDDIDLLPLCLCTCEAIGISR